ncbi:DNA-directed RNA polymerase I subunit rpa49 [Yamadazyma tenuis]|uniref:RNA polymerase I associated factor, A49-like protein n=1 Tax=Candida tenuis (strain ATCC 10573 / BCRC 21748 / CBS 615 / JCM 9827 / NBRC 10315 / NRRL Y-1498 / VKM Y-70) TaxID=590646 RepID=G3B5D5_CANTC|nr:RNA polymerase I associated factor, A49-like protein [Yamadazyma tenuis ATCC 10573]EGV63192.1 RNA polymerase I associated factor, A49-like protein [Yamadazyma tenuis ATCC 10573]WEJ96984.1 DNA-directed RNA polymerase I subunit rpa49 [Yamadazyma tenuis]
MAGTKRKANDDSYTNVAIKEYSQESNMVVGAFFNGLSVDSSTEFDVYKHKSKNQFELHGENDTLEYNAGSNEDEEAHAYTLAIYDPSTKSVELYESPMLNGRVISKSKRQYKGPKVKQLGIRNNLQRTALGEAFGTKKAKSAISNLERNRIDSDKLQDVELDIVDSVRESTQALPTKVQMDQDSSELRPTPRINMEATSSDDIYPVENIIPSPDWDAIRINSILDAPTTDSKLELLPFSSSDYIRHHIDAEDQTKLKFIYYLSILLGIYHNRRSRDKATLLTKFKTQPSEMLIDTILKTFTVSKSGKFGKSKDKSFFIDPHNEDKLLCYILAIIFHVNNFLIELQPLAYELNLKPNKLVNLCRIMGANVKPPTVGQAEALSIPKALMATSKLASLKAPVRLPDMSKRGARR